MVNIYKEVGEHVRARRLKLGMTLENLGEISGIHASFIGQIERDVKRASLETLATLAAALGLPVAKLFNKVPLTKLPLERELDAILRSNSAKEKKVLLDALRELSKGLKSLR